MLRILPGFTVWVLLLFAIAFPWALAWGDDADRVTYNRDIRPILSSKCFQCHGFDSGSREAGLRLDLEDASRDAIEPHDAGLSELYLRITSDDPDTLMPPPEIEKAITDEESELIRRWINQGAQYQEHWVYTPIASPDFATGPNVTLEKKAATIDRYLKRGFESNGVTPVEQADPRVLLRRLSFDLRGLPPSAEEVTAFIADPSSTHYREYVDRWIDSIEYAENQSRRWLDLVRFADTSGLVSDEPIATGLYRKYVIESFHTNQPFDQFTIEQLAGDLLDNPTDDQLIASAYNRLIKTNCEAGVIDEEALYAMKGEHVRGVGAVWLAATTGCAECHDHKFDPITAQDYYSLAAFFDDLVEVGVYTPGDYRKPIHFVHDDAKSRKLDRSLSAQIRTLKAEIHDAEIDASSLEEWRRATEIELKDTKTPADYVWIDAWDETALIHEGDYDRVQLDQRDARVTTSDAGWIAHRQSETMSGFFKAAGLEKARKDAAFFVDVWIDPEQRPDLLAIQLDSGVYGRVGWKTSEYRTFYWGDESKQSELLQSIPGADQTIRIGDVPDLSGWTRLRIPTGKLAMRYDLVGVRWGHLGGRVGWGDTGVETNRSKSTEFQLNETVQRLWWDRPYYRMTFEDRMGLVRKSVLQQFNVDEPLQKRLIELAFLESTQPERLSQLRALEARLSRLRSDAKMTLVSRAGQPKSTRLLPRGDFMDQSGPIVEPAIPEFLGTLDTGDRRATRLDLAEWIVGDDNPITARVYVNRVWQQLFGRGISETLDDSGGQGDWPSHPELLDWLAAEFRDNGWNRKSLTKAIVLTDAYRRSSIPTEALSRSDPNNEFLARQNRFRFEGEWIRDSALAAAGLLTPTDQIPEESFFPYQPDVYWGRSSKIMYGSRHMPWAASRAEDQYQRTIYSFWKRQNIHPTMLAFDAPTRQECTPMRTTTNTPGQALAMLNDPIFVDAAIGLADRALHDESANSDVDRIGSVFRFALQRPPTNEEIDAIAELLESQLEHYHSHPEDADALLAIGQAARLGRRGDVAEMNAAEINSSQRAAWTVAARVVLNLHEFITRY